MLISVMKSGISYLAMIFLLASWSLTNIATAACVSGTSIIKTDTDEEVEEATDEQVEEGQKKAISAAWDRYIKSLDGDHLKAYMDKKGQILENLGFYVSNLKKEATRNFSESDQVLKSTVCLDIDKERIASVLKVKKEPKEIESGTGSPFMALFVARQAATAESFEATVKKNKSSGSKSKAKEMARASGGKAVSYTSQKSKSRSQSGGSTVRKSDDIKYKIISGGDFNTFVTGPLSKAGYESTEYAELEGAAEDCGRTPSVEAVSQTFKTKNKMASRHWNKIRKAARKCEIKYFARGTMTVDASRNYRGRRMVMVRVNVAVYDVSKRFSRKVAAVVKQWPGFGINENSARTSAIKKAGGKTGELILKTLRKKGLK